MKSKKTLVILAVLFIISFAYTKFTQNDAKHVGYEIPSENLTVSFLDVGQGDSEFIQLPNGECMLIDASTQDMGNEIVDYIKNRGYKKIDYVVATHPHADHIGGLKQVLNSFEIGTVYMTQAVTTTKTYTDLLYAIQDKNIKLQKAKMGTGFSVEQVKIEFLSPVSDNYEDLNNWSAVVKITFGETEFLFTGDAEEFVERQLINRGADVKADVLKVAHHGSNTSSSLKFLKRCQPEIAVIECGKDNEYGHPHNEVLERIESVGAKIYRTDLDGDIVITSNGTEVTKL